MSLIFSRTFVRPWLLACASALALLSWGPSQPAEASRGHHHQSTSTSTGTTSTGTASTGTTTTTTTSSQQTGNLNRQAGVYVDWGDPYGRESNVEAFEQWLGRTGLLALDYTPGDSWDNFTATMAWLPGYWWQYNPNRNLVWSIQLTMAGTGLAQIAAGLEDSAYEYVASQIAWAQPNAIIRIGWEANGDWFPWSAATGEQTDYIAAFRHVAAIFKAASPGFRIDWCVNFGPVNVPADQIYPGDDVVDIIGMDIYDNNPQSATDPEASWQNYLNSPYGLIWHKQFAAQHNKPMSYPEWGVGQQGDNPTFVSGMANWIANNNVLYNDYWNTDAGYPGMISNGQYPQSADVFLQYKP